MPHSSRRKNKKGRIVKSSTKNYRNTYIIVGVIIAVIVGSAAWYSYSSAHNTTTTSTILSSSTSDTGLVYATIDTSQGTIQVELFQSLTPKTVSNFVSLVKSSFYTDLVWHRIVKGSYDLIQTGDPATRNGGGDPCNGWGDTSSPQTVPLEIVPSLHNYAGYLGIARSTDPNSGSSQFYVNLTNNTSFDGSYTVFGKVISGLGVAEAIDNLPTNPSCTTSEGGPPANPSQAMVLSIVIQNSS